MANFGKLFFCLTNPLVCYWFSYLLSHNQHPFDASYLIWLLLVWDLSLLFWISGVHNSTQK